jgi:SAM-dependent methyltransferase
MASVETDAVFAGSVPELYERYLVPMIFESYAQDLVTRVQARPPARLLEIAAGTGAVTRALAAALPETVAITATDLNPGMLAQARSRPISRTIEWGLADVTNLPFPDAAFDTVVCQFGAMFFPDKPRAFAEVKRVLATGGRFLFNVWTELESNEFAHTVMASLERVFPVDPPRFMQRTPHGYSDPTTIARDLAAGGFTKPPAFSTVSGRSLAASARDVAIAYCQGTPMRGEIETRDATRLEEATRVAAQAVEERFGPGAIDGRIQALVIDVER